MFLFFVNCTCTARQSLYERMLAFLTANQPKQLRSQGLKTTQSGLRNLKAKISRITVKIQGFGNSTNKSFSVAHLRMKEKKKC